jgi:hypothetical protein
MDRDPASPVVVVAVAVAVAVLALVSLGNFRRGSRRRAADVAVNGRRPLHTWEDEGGAVPEARSVGSPTGEPSPGNEPITR